MQFLALVLASLAASVFADPIVVDTLAKIVQCAETDISWTGGTGGCIQRTRLLHVNSTNERIFPPETVSQVIKDNGDIVGEADLVFSTTYAWGGYGCPAGSSVVFTVTDYDGNGASTAPVIVSDSSDSGCVGPSA
ncbi:hypothetical protein V8D89_001010 [Ganoderma adspersum]